MYVCSCFGITEEQVHAHKDSGACTPRQIASACKAGTDCGSCVRRIQTLLGRPVDCSRKRGALSETLLAGIAVPASGAPRTVAAGAGAAAEADAPAAERPAVAA
ncbi:(2Fe-2S)-binding protein [Wenjunlia tyrosinilytica]|uniref:(2Fe-2S)-binding protein n=1 Tax=Wenjunlia tyrosinilytica TaxID=1544741 RepID=UPI00166C7358|nr:(2Fe-2S)-binding protein [Wenjunlia tyrosinilytica]